MSMLLLKIFLAPLIITICTLAARRYGHAIGGIIVGLPLTSGPVALILALEHGVSFVEGFSNGVLSGLMLVAVFNLAYAYAATRFHWILCVIIGWTIYGLAAYFLAPVSFPITCTYLLVSIFLFIVIRFFPPHQEKNLTIKAPKWDLPVRIAVASSLVFFLSYLSGRIDARLVGIVTAFPVYATIFSASTHYHHGQNAAISLLKGILTGSFSFALFFLIIGTTIFSLGSTYSFLAAIAAASLLQLLLYKGKNLLKA